MQESKEANRILDKIIKKLEVLQISYPELLGFHVCIAVGSDKGFHGLARSNSHPIISKEFAQLTEEFAKDFHDAVQAKAAESH